MNNSNGLIELLKTFATAFVIWLVVMGYWPMTPEQQAVTLGLLIAGINVFGFLWQSSKVTSLGNPKAADGEPLVRASQSPVSAATKDPMRGK